MDDGTERVEGIVQRKGAALMPDLQRPARGFHHTLDSALATLAEMGIPAARVSLRMDGTGGSPLQVLSQIPMPEVPLLGDVDIVLSIAGLGFWNRMPVAMWESGGERELGTREILELLDDPLQKAHSWVREGSRLFEIAAGNAAACARWIRLFGLDPAAWPEKTLYPLALLLPRLHRVAGTREGIALALGLLLGLDLHQIRTRKNYRMLDDADLHLLGRGVGQLGVDCILSDRIEDFGCAVYVLGPVSLDIYRSYQQDRGRELLRQTLALVVPCYQRHEVSWLVGDPERAPRLAMPDENAALGINSYLGKRSGAENIQPHRAA